MLRTFEIFVKRKVRQYFNAYHSKKDRTSLVKEDFVIVSKNCWGGQFYKWMDKPYNTPFVGLFLCGPCYIKLLNNFDFYLKQELKFVEKSKYKTNIKKEYPIALLDDIEIHFQHYENKEEAIEKWNRRKERLLGYKNRDNFYFTICDRRGATDEIIKEFHSLPYKNKVSFGLNKIDGLTATQHIKVYDNPNGKLTEVHNGKKLFKLTFLYFDLINWINTGAIKRTRFKE